MKRRQRVVLQLIAKYFISKYRYARNMANYQTPESKKQEFRKYLEKSGVIDAFTKGKY
jgi:hypothetical protein